MTDYEKGYKDGMAGAALPNIVDNGDKIDGYTYMYKTDSDGIPFINIESVRFMLNKAADVQPVKHGRWEYYKNNGIFDTHRCTLCGEKYEIYMDIEPTTIYKYCPNCGADMRGDTNG